MFCKDCLYALGDQFGKYLSSVEVLSVTEILSKGEWKHMEQMQKARAQFTAVSCHNAIYAIGGYSSKKTMKSVKKYDPEVDKWSYVSSMNFERRKHAACVVDGKIIIVGEVDAEGDAIHEIECYDPSKDVWSIVGETKEELYDH